MLAVDTAVRNRRNTWSSNCGARDTVVPIKACIAVAVSRILRGLNLQMENMPLGPVLSAWQSYRGVIPTWSTTARRGRCPPGRQLGRRTAQRLPTLPVGTPDSTVKAQRPHFNQLTSDILRDATLSLRCRVTNRPESRVILRQCTQNSGFRNCFQMSCNQPKDSSS